MKPIIVVVEGVSAGRYYAEEALRRGYEPVNIFPNSASSEAYQRLRDAALHYWSSLGLRTLEPKDDSPEAMLSLVRELSPVAVVAGSELGVPWTDYLNKALGLPGNNPATSIQRRNKYEMHQRLEACGVPSLRSQKCATLEACMETARAWQMWPIVVKPLAGAGSDGVSFCRNEEEVAQKCSALLERTDLFGTVNSQVLLQEFARGTEYIVNTVSSGGRHAVTDVWRYDKIPVGSKGVAYNYAALVVKPNETERALFDYALDVVSALGFEYGPSHTEIMLTPQGPRLIETGARPMGGFFPPDLLRDVLGHELVDLSLDAVLDPAAFARFASKPYCPRKTAVLKVVISSASYPVAALPYEAILMEAPAAKRWEFSLVESTGRVFETVDLESAAGEVFLSHENAEVVWRTYEALRFLESEAQTWLFEDKPHVMKAPILHAAGAAVPFTSQTTCGWLDVIRQVGRFSREMPEGATLMVEAGNADPEADRVFGALLEVFGWHPVEYGTYRKACGAES